MKGKNVSVKIGHHFVGDGAPCFVIGEIGINHNGSIAQALQLIDVAVGAECQAVKFQVRDVPVVYSAEERAVPREFDQCFIKHAFSRMESEGVTYPVFPDEGQLSRLRAWLEGKDVQTFNGDLKYALEFGSKDWDTIRSHCERRGIYWGVSSWDGLSVQMIDGFGIAFHKVASACLPHADLLRRIRKCGKPVILSTGGSTMEQVERAVEILGRNNLIILHCVATYPSADEESNLALISTLRKKFHGIPIGYSGHEADIEASLAAVSLGAYVVERHITLDKTLPGSDQKASIDPDTLKELVSQIRHVETVRGTRH